MAVFNSVTVLVNMEDTQVSGVRSFVNHGFPTAQRPGHSGSHVSLHSEIDLGRGQGRGERPICPTPRRRKTAREMVGHCVGPVLGGRLAI